MRHLAPLLRCAASLTLAAALAGCGSSPPGPLCNDARTLCVSAAATISNPMRIDVKTANLPGRFQLVWQIDDSTGQMLGGSTPGEYDSERDQDASGTFHIQDFLFMRAAADHGTLVLHARGAPDTEDFAELRVPVRLPTGSSEVTTLTPEDPDALRAALVEWTDQPHREGAVFDPPLKLVPQRTTIMRIPPDAQIGATAEAALRAHPGQAAFHVKDWTQENGTAQVELKGEGWAGVSFYLLEVEYLVRRSLLALPGISAVEFGGADR